MSTPFGGTDPVALARIQSEAAQLEQIKANVKRAVEGLTAQPKGLPMPVCVPADSGEREWMKR